MTKTNADGRSTTLEAGAPRFTVTITAASVNAVADLRDHGRFYANQANIEEVLSSTSRWDLATWVAKTYEAEFSEHHPCATATYWNAFGKIVLAIVALDLGYNS